MNLTDKCRTFYPTTAEYIYFSSVHGTFSRVDHVLGHKTCLSKFKKTEIIRSILSDHNGIKLEKKKKIGKFMNTWKLNNSPVQPIDQSRN